MIIPLAITCYFVVVVVVVVRRDSFSSFCAVSCVVCF